MKTSQRHKNPKIFPTRKLRSETYCAHMKLFVLSVFHILLCFHSGYILTNTEIRMWKISVKLMIVSCIDQWQCAGANLFTKCYKFQIEFEKCQMAQIRYNASHTAAQPIINHSYISLLHLYSYVSEHVPVCMNTTNLRQLQQLFRSNCTCFPLHSTASVCNFSA